MYRNEDQKYGVCWFDSSRTAKLGKGRLIYKVITLNFLWDNNFVWTTQFSHILHTAIIRFPMLPRTNTKDTRLDIVTGQPKVNIWYSIWVKPTRDGVLILNVRDQFPPLPWIKTFYLVQTRVLSSFCKLIIIVVPRN